MGGITDFLRTIPRCLYPDSYKHLVNNKLSSAVLYLPAIVLLSLIIMCAIYAPAVVSFPSTMENAFARYKSFDVTVNQSMKAPIVLPEDDPFITIDTTGKYTELEQGNILVTGDKIDYNPGLSTQTIEIGDDINMLNHKENLVKLFTLIFVMLLPSIIILAYLVYLIKFSVIIILATLIGFLVARISKNTLSFLSIFKAAIYASTIMVMVELIAKPFNISKWLVAVPLPFGFSLMIVPITLFVIYLIIGVALAGHDEMITRKK